MAEEIEIVEIGAKPGEKLYEELMSDEETRRALELKRYFVVTPAFKGVYSNIAYEYDGLINQHVTNPYISAEVPSLSINEISGWLTSNGLIDPAT